MAWIKWKRGFALPPVKHQPEEIIGILCLEK
jgi:hypothetical protein